jgi:pimeloyl-ACP methyl ester carboxylesterase
MSAGNYAQVNGINMYYEIHGEGKPLVLIHGGGSTIETSFSIILPMLAKGYKIIAFELQAHGHTSDREAPESFVQDADDVAELLKQLSISKANILGFSNGGSTTMQIAIRHPEIVDKIIVIAGAFKREGFIQGFFDGMPHATLDNMPQSLQDAFLEINPDTNALFNMFSKDKQRMVDFKDWKDSDIQSIQSPALIISGDKDVITCEHALEISKLIPNSALMILPGMHGECIGETGTSKPNSMLPQATAMLIKEFLNS